MMKFKYLLLPILWNPLHPSTGKELLIAAQIGLGGIVALTGLKTGTSKMILPIHPQA